jgi:dual specificity tyrosine-phosphorylation-regulated kinase 2/3/4
VLLAHYNLLLTVFCSRVISDSHYQQSSNFHQQSNNPFLRQPTSQSSNELLYSTGNGSSRPGTHDHSASFSRNRSVQESSSSEFLPSVNFDDFHTSITGLNDMSLAAAANASSTSVNSMGSMGRSQQQLPLQHQQPQPGTNIGRSGSLVRRYSNARKPVNSQHQPHNSRDMNNMPPPNAPGNRGRRQSTLSSSLAQASAGPNRQPRKSIGPGFMAQSTSALRSSSRDARVPPTQSQPMLIRSNSINRSQQPGSLIPNGIQGPNGTAARNGRIKSLQPPPRGQSHGNLLFAGSNVQPEGPQSSPRPRTSGRNTPPSSGGSRRLSTVYVGGLGARTISPTDARRLRRLSQVPKQPEVPQMPPVSQPELVIARQHTQSPVALVAPKSITPSSSTRNTPDFTRKAVNSVQSVSSNSSFNSMRPSANSGPRNSQILAASRLPTAKPRNVHSSTGFVEEEVPPVPAIPKAYESPKDNPLDPASYFSRKQIEHDDSNQRPPPQPTNAPPPPPPVDDPRYENAPNPRHRRGLTVGSGSEPEKQNAMSPNLNKKNLQPLRLPPLNLLPLSGPTTNRIASLPAPSGEVDTREASTPPPRRNATKTPSTPMTASKAQFYHRASEDDLSGFRSSSSHHPVRPNGLNMHDPQFGLSAPIPVPGTRNNASPFASNSLPKLGDFGSFSATPNAVTPVESTFQSTPFLLPQEQNDYNLPSPKTTGPASNLPQNSTRTSTSDEPPPTPASTSSLRRKLSLTWKRSSSKASQRAQAAAVQAEKDEAKAKQNEMPPPKMPASATWTARTSSDAGSIRGSFDTKVRKPSGSMPAGQEIRMAPQHAHQPSDPASVKSEPSNPPAYADQRRPVPRSASNSILTPVQRILGSKGPMNTLRSRNLDTNLDKDDLAADKVMEKLASKRRDFETAAKEVDDLRRRAHPKDRVSPTQAIQMVNLNIFERGEIVDFKEVFFCGTRNAKKIVGNADQSTTNFGYDDERGDYNIIFGDHLCYRYEVVDMLGKGSFGQVVRCIDHKTGGLVAIKIIRNKKRFHQQALVEVNILQKLREWVSDFPMLLSNNY